MIVRQVARRAFALGFLVGMSWQHVNELEPFEKPPTRIWLFFWRSLVRGRVASPEGTEQ